MDRRLHLQSLRAAELDIFNPGVSDVLTPDHFDFSLTTARYLHLGLPGVHKHLDRQWQDDVNGWVTVLKRARAAGLKTNLELASINPVLLAKLVLPCLPYLDLIIVNDGEIGALSGHAPSCRRWGDRRWRLASVRRGRCWKMATMDIVVVHCPVIAIAVTRDGKVFTEAIHANTALSSSPAPMARAMPLRLACSTVFTRGGASMMRSRLAHASAAASLRSLSTTGAVEPWRKCLKLANEVGLAEGRLNFRR